MSRWDNVEGMSAIKEKRSAEGKRLEEKHFRKEKRSAEKKSAEGIHSAKKTHFMKKDSPEQGYFIERADCKDFEKLIPEFIAKKMDYPTLKRFYEHVQHCPDCREELEIQFLVQEGMLRLEEGNAFDLQSELKQRMEDAAKSIRYHSVFLYLGIAMEIVAVGLLAGIVIWILL